MVQYIDKSVLVAEIERRLDELYDLLPDASKVEKEAITISEACNTGKYTALESFRRFLDTLEVKEVDFKKEFTDYTKDILVCDVQFAPYTHLKKCAKHFFELGLSVSNKAKKGE